MASTLHASSTTVRLRGRGHGCRQAMQLLLPRQCSSCLRARSSYVSSDPSKAWLSLNWTLRSCSTFLRAIHDNNSGNNSSNNPGDEDDELDRLLGIGRYRDDSTGFFSSLNRGGSSGTGSGGSSSEDGQAGNGEAGDTLADIIQMEVRRVRAKEELMSDLEDRKTQMRAIGEEMKAALAREYELDRMRTEIGANYAMSEAFHALDDVEKEVQRIKQQLQADKADLAAWEAQTAEERSRGLFFKSLYSLDKEPRQPVGKSIPGYWRKQRAAAAAAAAAAAEAAAPTPSGADAAGGDTAWDPEVVAAAAQRPLSAASQQIRSPFRLYLFSYLSAFLALLVINDVLVMSSVPRPEAAEAAAVEAAVTMPHVAKDALYGMLSAGLGYVAVLERQALGQAQEAMLEGIRRTAGRPSSTSSSPRPPLPSQQQQQHQQQQQQDGDEP